MASAKHNFHYSPLLTNCHHWVHTHFQTDYLSESSRTHHYWQVQRKAADHSMIFESTHSGPAMWKIPYFERLNMCPYPILLFYTLEWVAICLMRNPRIRVEAPLSEERIPFSFAEFSSQFYLNYTSFQTLIISCQLSLQIIITFNWISILSYFCQFWKFVQFFYYSVRKC